MQLAVGAKYWLGWSGCECLTAGAMPAMPCEEKWHQSRVVGTEQEKYHLKLPEFPGHEQCVKIASRLETNPAHIRGQAADIPLNETDADADPFKQFDAWFRDAVERSGMREPTAMALATADDKGVPSVRMVLLKVKSTICTVLLS